MRTPTTKERWEPIPGYETYLLSNRGNVFRLPGKSGTTGGLVKITMVDGKYPRVCLCENQVKAYPYVATLMSIVWPEISDAK